MTASLIYQGRGVWRLELRNPVKGGNTAVYVSMKLKVSGSWHTSGLQICSKLYGKEKKERERGEIPSGSASLFSI